MVIENIYGLTQIISQIIIFISYRFFFFLKLTKLCVRNQPDAQRMLRECKFIDLDQIS